MTNKVTKQIQVALQKADALKTRFSKAKETAHAEAEQLRQDLQKAEAEAHEIYKMYVLGDVELSGYNEATKAVDEKKKMLKVAEGKASDINKIQKEELASIYQNEIEPLDKAFRAEDGKNKAEQRKAMFQAKVDYLHAIHSCAKEVQKTHRYKQMVDALKVESGLKNDYAYDMEDAQVINLLHNDFNNRAGLDVFREEITKAYHNNVITSQVQEEAQ